MVWAQAMAACSTTRRNSRERSECMWLSVGQGTVSASVTVSVSVSVLVSVTVPVSVSIAAPAARSGGVRREFASRRAIVAVAEQVVGLHDRVNLTRALVDDRAFAVAVETADGILVRVAVGAVDLDGVARRPL